MFDELRELMRAAPFAPFRIHASDGRHFDVYHPEFMGFSRSTVAVGEPTDDPDHFRILQVRNITSIERLPETQRQP